MGNTRNISEHQRVSARATVVTTHLYNELWLAACKAPLPGGLKVLDFEIVFRPSRPSFGDQFADSVEDFRRVFDLLGAARTMVYDDVSIFATDSKAIDQEKEQHVRLTLVLPEATLVKWFGE